MWQARGVLPPLYGVGGQFMAFNHCDKLYVTASEPGSPIYAFPLAVFWGLCHRQAYTNFDMAPFTSNIRHFGASQGAAQLVCGCGMQLKDGRFTQCGSLMMYFSSHYKVLRTCQVFDLQQERWCCHHCMHIHWM